MLSVNDENYRKYEVYYLMNFVLLGLGAQEEKFYVKSIIPVSGNSHYQAVDLDHDFNSNITNPLYQLFASCFLNFISITPFSPDTNACLRLLVTSSFRINPSGMDISISNFNLSVSIFVYRLLSTEPFEKPCWCRYFSRW